MGYYDDEPVWEIDSINPGDAADELTIRLTTAEAARRTGTTGPLSVLLSLNPDGSVTWQDFRLGKYV